MKPPAFDRAGFTLPRRQSFNGDVEIEAYRPAKLILAGKHRKGIREPLDFCSSPDEHIRYALKDPFPLSAATPLQRELKAASAVSRDIPPVELVEFWGAQNTALESLISNCSLAQKKWDNSIAPEILTAAAKFRTVALKQLLRQHNLGGARWLGQFAFGFPITGSLSQRYTYDLADRDKLKDRIPRSQLFEAASLRFRERAAKYGHKDAQVIWGEALQQVEKGWLFAPHPLSADGKPLSWRAGRFDISFRFGVSQADKLRACYDLKHSVTNLACSVETPNQLVSWGHLSQLSQLLSQGGGDWSLLKSDHGPRSSLQTAANWPLGPAFRHPSTHLWYGFVTRTLLFGSVEAVFHYNVLSRILAALTNRCLGIPPIAYFDDFAALIRRALGERALAASTRFCTLLGFQLNPKKSVVGPSVSFLGQLGDFPPNANNRHLMISLPVEKRKSWSDLIGGFLKEARISHICLGNLIGELSFSQTSLFCKFARTQMRPLQTKLNRRVYNARLSAGERLVSTWWARAIADFTPRLAIPRPSRPDWLIYTDAATDPPSLFALLFEGRRASPRLRDLCASTRAPVTWPYLSRRTSLIYGLELLPLVLFMEAWAPFLQGISCWIYLDNNNCLSALVRVDSDTDVIAVLVARLWHLAQIRNICVWFSRARSKNQSR